MILETKMYRARIRVPWRLRFKYWRTRRRLRMIGFTELEEEFARRLSHALLYGEEEKCRER